MEVRATASEELAARLDAVETAVDGGATDLKALGFWALVARVKPDRVLVDEHADQIGRIDEKAFRAWARFRTPVWLGNLLLVAGIVVGGLAVGVAYRADAAWLKGVALIVAGAAWSICFHGPAHWLVGRAIGIRFTSYFLGGPPPPRPGLKTAYGSYLRADPSSRAWFHASGALATKAAPFLALAFWPGSGAPWWSAAALLALGIVQIVTDVTLSVRSSDWKKFRRERAVARAMEPSPPSMEPAGP